jgi:HEAT repeat protein
VDVLVLRIAGAVLAVSFLAWIGLSAVVLIGRARYDRRQRCGSTEASAREIQRLLRRAERQPRTEWGRWQRIGALTRLSRMRHPAGPHLLYLALSDRNPEVVASAIRLLGSLGDLWAMEVLVAALREGRAPRSRIAAQLDRLEPEPGYLLLPLLRDPDPAVRFWGATLIGSYRAIGEEDLVALTHDEDGNVRAAAVEALGHRSSTAAASATVALLDDPAWFVRVHAARSAGHVAGAAAAPAIARLLADERWWVRTAAKDALRGLGQEAIPALAPVLSSFDRFARNGAAEVLQDIGLVDHLALDDPENPLLARIYAAGGPGLREAAEERTARARELKEAQEAA